MTQLPQWKLPAYNWQSPLLRSFSLATPTPKSEADILAMAAAFKMPGHTPEQVESYIRNELATLDRWPIFRNGNTARSYQVQLMWNEKDELFPAPDVPSRMVPALVHISIKRVDKAPVHDWRHFQEIKNMLVGPTFEAMELYPAEARVVDTANQYHLWAFGNPEALKTIGFPVGLKQDENAGGARQRARKET